MDFSFTEGNCVWIVLSPETHLKTPPLLLKFLRDNKDVREKIRQAATKHRFSTWEAVWVDHEFFQYPFLLEKNTPDVATSKLSISDSFLLVVRLH
jgi:hypothetical protein